MYIPTRRAVTIHWAIVCSAIGFTIGHLVYLTRAVSFQNCLWLLAGCAVTVWILRVALRDSAIYASTKPYHPMRRRIIKRFDQLLEEKPSATLRCGAEALVLLTEGPKLFKRRIVSHVTFDDSSNILDASQPRFASFREYVFSPPPVAAVIKRTSEAMIDDAGDILPDAFDAVDSKGTWSWVRTVQQLDKAKLLEADLDELTFLTQALDEWDVEEGDLPH